METVKLTLKNVDLPSLDVVMELLDMLVPFWNPGGFTVRREPMFFRLNGWVSCLRERDESLLEDLEKFGKILALKVSARQDNCGVYVNLSSDPKTLYLTPEPEPRVVLPKIVRTRVFGRGLSHADLLQVMRLLGPLWQSGGLHFYPPGDEGFGLDGTLEARRVADHDVEQPLLALKAWPWSEVWDRTNTKRRLDLMRKRMPERTPDATAAI